MKRALALYLPTWSVNLIQRRERATHAPHHASPHAAQADLSHRPVPSSPRSRAHAVLIVSVVSQQQLVVHCCANAAAAGVRPHMPLADARALLAPRPVAIHPYNPERDLAALRALAQWALRFSPLVSLDPPDGLLIDISGCQRLYRGEPRLLRRLSRALARLGLHARIAAAPTFAAAWALSRFARTELTILPGQNARAALAPLPVAALNIPTEAVEALDEVGVTTIAHLLQLPRAALPSRFGDSLLLRLDQALGRAIEPFSGVKPILPLRLERLFDGPTTQLEAIELAAHALLADLTARLAERESGALRLTLLLERPAAEPVSLLLTLGRPSRNLKHLWALLRPRLQDVNLGFGVERLELTANRTARLRHEQSAYCATDERCADTDSSFWEFADTLIARLGPDAVLQPSVRSTHVPERVFRWRSILESDPAERKQWGGNQGNAAAGADDPPAPVAHRPSLLLDTPEPIDVLALTPDGPVMRLTWRGEQHSVLHSAGPERIAPEWWRRGVRDAETPAVTDATRDYFTLHTHRARTLWVYRELETARWFLHGEWG